MKARLKKKKLKTAQTSHFHSTAVSCQSSALIFTEKLFLIHCTLPSSFSGTELQLMKLSLWNAFYNKGYSYRKHWKTWKLCRDCRESLMDA